MQIFLALTKELDNVGIPYCGFGPDVFTCKSSSSILPVKDPDIGAVVVGHDQHFSYPKMYKAATYLYDKNIHFIGANPDEQYISAGNKAPTPGSLT